jgi:hypothetical protein
VDLNYLFSRQQIERSRAQMAKTPASRRVHQELAEHYERFIEEMTAERFGFLRRPQA